jgi:hypothetical protein
MSVPKEFQITTDEVNALNSIVFKLHGYNKFAGWHDKPREAGTDCALIHSEISEAMEGFRKNLNDDHLPHRPMAEVEFADAVIRIADTCGKYGFDLGNALLEKSVYNAHRADHKKEAREAEGGKTF